MGSILLGLIIVVLAALICLLTFSCQHPAGSQKVEVVAFKDRVLGNIKRYRIVCKECGATIGGHYARDLPDVERRHGNTYL